LIALVAWVLSVSRWLAGRFWKPVSISE
jgi:hypothetical protein